MSWKVAWLFFTLFCHKNEEAEGLVQQVDQRQQTEEDLEKQVASGQLMLSDVGKLLHPEMSL